MLLTSDQHLIQASGGVLNLDHGSALVHEVEVKPDA